MKLSENFSFVRVCPATKYQLFENQYRYSSGVCPHCGHEDKGTFTHSEVIVGKWEYPSIFERLILHKKPAFHTKEELNV